MRKPWILAAACSTLALSGCVAERAAAVARSASTSSGVEVTSTRLVTGAPSACLATPAVVAKAPSDRPINATCPVMLGNPVDAKVTATWNGAIVAFCDESARATWTADPARFAGNLPRISGSGGDGAPVAPVARRRTVSTARVVPAIPKAPPLAAIGSPDGAPMPLPAAAPAAFVLGSPDGAVLPLPPATRSVVRPAAERPLAPAAAPVRAQTPPRVVAPVGADHGEDAEDCEDCPGGVCRVPGM